MLGDDDMRALVRLEPFDPANRKTELDVLARREEAREPRRLTDERDRVAPEAGAGVGGVSALRQYMRASGRPDREGHSGGRGFVQCRGGGAPGAGAGDQFTDFRLELRRWHVR